MKRVFLIVLDSFGIGQMPDSEAFGDVNVNTLASCVSSGVLNIPNMIAAGLGNIDGVTCLPKVATTTGAYAPVFILLSDGQPTDNIQKGLNLLAKNNWYRAAMKIAIAVDEGNTSALEKFTGSPETVLKVNSNRDDLKKLLCRLAVVSSTMQSRSKSAAEAGASTETGGQQTTDPADDPTITRNAIGTATEGTDVTTASGNTPGNNPWAQDGAW